jgi:photosystem II stability/assembly factor-like uncharacterized protein
MRTVGKIVYRMIIATGIGAGLLTPAPTFGASGAIQAGHNARPLVVSWPPPDVPALPRIVYSGYGSDESGQGVYVEAAQGSVSVSTCGPIGVADTLLVDPNIPTRLYAGSPSGLFISNDNCQSWNRPRAPLTGSVSAIAVGPAPAGAIPGVLGGTVSGTLYVAVLPDALWSSNDGGAHWQVHHLPRRTPITTLTLLPGKSPVLLAGSGAGIFTTRDGGGTWLSTQPQLATAGGINAMALDPSHPGTIFTAAVDGVYRSADAGATWTRALAYQSGNIGPLPTSVPSHALIGFPAIAISSKGVILVGDDTADVYRSTDQGRTWSTPEYGSGGKDGIPPITALAFAPFDPLQAYGDDAEDHELSSSDGGSTWSMFWSGTSNVISCYAGTPVPLLPVDPVPTPVPLPAGARYVPQTHHLIEAPFLRFYQQNGGERAFGLPLTEAYEEAGQRVQVFERARLVATGNSVTISPLGVWLTAGSAYPSVLSGPAGSGQRYFPETHQVLAGRFLTYWLAHNGALLLGPPISPEIHAQNGDGSKRSYLMQYFANGRLEYHPELHGTPYEVSLGLVGREFLQERNWL